MRTERPRGPDRRRRRAMFRFPDRRTGFDRRRPGGLLAWYRDRPAVIAAALAAIVALNVADYTLTVQALERGAREANPIMATLFAHDPALALAFKLFTATAVVLVIWQLRRYRKILGVSLLAVGGFGLLVVYQIGVVAALS